MKLTKMSHIILSILLLLHLFTHTHSYTFIYAGCSTQKYQPSSPYEANLNSLLTSLVSSSSQQTFYDNFAIGNSTSTLSPATTTTTTTTPTPIYGLYQCRGDLKPDDCSNCIQTAVSQIGLICPYSYGATLQLEGCYIRYEEYDFLGKLDTTITYKRCSKSSIGSENNSPSEDFFSKRDEVLSSLESGTGFRVSAYGSVQGVAQCIGDLSISDCSNCLREAVKELKILCGPAAAAHVYLAKCFAQYWAAGYYDLATRNSDPTHDDVAKTIAIIVGIIGGVAVLIVLLSVCRRSCGGGHGGGK